MTITKKPLQPSKQSIAKQKRKLNYKNACETLLRRYFHFWEFYVTITFPYEIKPEQANGKLKKFQRLVNELCGGKDWEKQQEGVLFAGVVQVHPQSKYSKRLHLHCLIGLHPRLNIPMLISLARNTVGKQFTTDAFDAQAVTRDQDLDQVLIPYVMRFVNPYQDWRCPLIWVPRRLLRLNEDDSGRYIDPTLSNDSLPTLMTVEELCKHIPIAPSMVSKLITRGEIPHYRIGRKTLFHPADIIPWLNSNRHSPESSSDNDLTVEIDQLMRDVDNKTKMDNIGDIL